MNGPRILLIVLVVLGALLWGALVGNPDADIERGREETQLAFDAVETELALLEPLYQEVSSRGLMLNLKTLHDDLRSQLADLRERRIEIENDESLGRRERLPAMRELVDESDAVLAGVRQLRQTVQARYEFMTVVSPLLAESRDLRDRISASAPQDPARVARASELGGQFSELEQMAKTTDRTLQANIQQGQQLGHAALNGLRGLIDAQRQLLAEIESAR